MPLNSLLDNKFAFMDHLSVSTTVVDSWRWWEFEEYIKRLNDKMEREEKSRKDQDSNQPKIPDYSQKMPDVNSMMRKYK